MVKKKRYQKKEPPAIEEQRKRSVTENTENKAESKDPLQEAKRRM